MFLVPSLSFFFVGEDLINLLVYFALLLSFKMSNVALYSRAGDTHVVVRIVLTRWIDQMKGSGWTWVERTNSWHKQGESVSKTGFSYQLLDDKLLNTLDEQPWKVN